MNTHPSFIIVFSTTVFFSLLLAIYPLSPTLSVIRPEFLCITVIYWVVTQPHRVGIFAAWCLGLLQDMVTDCVWGAHALALAFIAYFCLNAYRRLRNYSLTHQTLWVFIFVGIHQLFVNWIQGLDNYGTQVRFLFASAIFTTAFWPILVITMRKLKKRYRF